uniref:Uncharacterized protein n=1 Tax=viral metagenome TaxID=1070528 RepID=A0A6C0CZX9_9ZZZZ
MSVYRDDKKPITANYTNLSAETCFSCDKPCTCKYTTVRSNFDIMQYNAFVGNSNNKYFSAETAVVNNNFTNIGNWTAK